MHIDVRLFDRGLRGARRLADTCQDLIACGLRRQADRIEGVQLRIDALTRRGAGGFLASVALRPRRGGHLLVHAIASTPQQAARAAVQTARITFQERCDKQRSRHRRGHRERGTRRAA